MRVRYTLPFWWICLVLARWSSTGCIAGISVAWIPSQLAMSFGRLFPHSRLGATVVPPQFLFFLFPRSAQPYRASFRKHHITTYGYRATEKFDHLGVGTARAALLGLHSSLSHRVERCIRFVAMSGFSVFFLTD